MSNKLKVKDVPNAMALFICRQMHQGRMTSKQYLKGERSLGFTRKAKQMVKLGYKPNFAKYPSTYSWMN
ncbi:hypothetical protein MN04_00225 [Escherichia phage MN04]|uniref:Uncharacterized protein n=1 Tax=Escherichia phage MN04 TaxID=2711184 RepID=A0A858I6V8_9CAUD|nr:hypothetical protein MN04_00225 [Escherichia phage MN04]